AVVGGESRLTHHRMYECAIDPPDASRTVLGLNEIVFRTGPPFHMIEVEVAVKDEPVLRYSGDGLILSTPVGSTGHSLSAGGPILGQDLSAFVITPICPHALTNRPLVDSADKVYVVQTGRPTDGTTLILDGQLTIPLPRRHRITVRRAPVTFQLVKVPGHSYYRTLRNKLHWGMQPNYRQE